MSCVLRHRVGCCLCMLRLEFQEACWSVSGGQGKPGQCPAPWCGHPWWFQGWCSLHSIFGAQPSLGGGGALSGTHSSGLSVKKWFVLINGPT